MLQEIIGSRARARVLLFIANYGEGYARGIAQSFGYPIGMVQRQLRKLEEGGVFVSTLKGKTRLYTWNPRYSFGMELRALLEKALELLPPAETQKYFRARRRPRRADKSL